MGIHPHPAAHHWKRYQRTLPASAAPSPCASLAIPGTIPLGESGTCFGKSRPLGSIIISPARHHRLKFSHGAPWPISNDFGCGALCPCVLPAATCTCARISPASIRIRPELRCRQAKVQRPRSPAGVERQDRLRSFAGHKHSFDGGGLPQGALFSLPSSRRSLWSASEFSFEIFVCFLSCDKPNISRANSSKQTAAHFTASIRVLLR